MTQYARKTEVPVEKTKIEIERTLTRYGASGFGYMAFGRQVTILFEMSKRRYRLILTLPSEYDYSSKTAREQAVRSLWRSLLLVIKAKLVAVDAGISTLEEEFMANLVLPSGETAADWLLPQIASGYAQGQMPPLLLPEGDHDHA